MFLFHWQPVCEPLLWFHLVTGFCQMIWRMMFKKCLKLLLCRMFYHWLWFDRLGLRTFWTQHCISGIAEVETEGVCVLSACIWQSEGPGCQQQLCWHTNNILDEQLAQPSRRAQPSHSSKPPKWERNCIWDRWRANFVQYCDGWNKRNTNTKTARGFKDAFPASFFKLVCLQGCLQSHSCLCVLGMEEVLGNKASSETHLSCSRSQNSMKGCFSLVSAPCREV